MNGLFMEPSLPTSIKSPNRYIKDINYGISQKLDGRRSLIRVTDGTLVGYNRQGDLRSVSSSVSYLKSLQGTWIFDGEEVDRRYYVFDILQTPTTNMVELPLSVRLASLIQLADNLPELHVVPVYETNKQQFYDFCEAKGYEGVVFKDLRSPYRSGRTKSQLKYKFTHTADCIVIDMQQDGKDNLVLGMYNGDQIVECGRVSALTGHGQRIKLGDVVEVRYLYTSTEGRLYQPVCPKIRDDKSPNECTVDQLNETRPNRKVIGSSWIP